MSECACVCVSNQLIIYEFTSLGMYACPMRVDGCLWKKEKHSALDVFSV